MQHFSEDSIDCYAVCDLTRLSHTFASLSLINLNIVSILFYSILCCPTLSYPILSLGNFFLTLLITGAEADAVIQQIYQRLPGPSLQNTEAIWH